MGKTSTDSKRKYNEKAYDRIEVTVPKGDKAKYKVHAENKASDIRVTVVCPGRILTNVSLHALKADGAEYGVMDHAQANGISAEECAQRIMKGVRRGKKEMYVCRKDVLMVYFRRYIPSLYYYLVSRVKPN